ncbi:DUF7504 family protein [Haloplanus salilacus]|uniref:DUF7504 family protein n=1 Tax=Haloplanus salilacus TaxID=2949994 RepID=UPI0030D0B4A6
MATPPDRIDDTLAGCSSVLLLASSSDTEADACVTLLTRYAPERTNVLGATVSRSPGDRFALWRREVPEGVPKRAAMIDAGRGVRTRTERDVGDLPPEFTLDRLPEHAEPVDLGMALSRRLGSWESTPESTALCLHSLTALVGAFDRESVISLVDSLNRLCETVDAVGHHHMDPTAHDDETVAMFRPLYDAVIDVNAEDGWTVTLADTEADAPSFRRSTAPPGGAASTDPDRPETVPIPYSFDQTLDLISDARRRTLLYWLKDRGSGTVAFDDIVEAVVTRETSIPAREAPESRDSVRVSLAHAHLPKLADLGIVEYDPDGATVQYHGNPALESFLRYVETIELG